MVGVPHDVVQLQRNLLQPSLRNYIQMRTIEFVDELREHARQFAELWRIPEPVARLAFLKGADLGLHRGEELYKESQDKADATFKSACENFPHLEGSHERI